MKALYNYPVYVTMVCDTAMFRMSALIDDFAESNHDQTLKEFKLNKLEFSQLFV